MKTPHEILLIRGETSEPVFNPVTGGFDQGDSEKETVPCLFQYLSKAKQFEQYGSRDDRVAVVRFNQEQEPFNKAKHNNRTFVPIESIDAPVKGSVRLKEVIE